MNNGTMKSTPKSDETASGDRYRSDHERWAALAGRDSVADGCFFYAVSTTRVYCRPHCASRLPRRENVQFFPSSRAAEAAGFRPCRRCKPDKAGIGGQRAEIVARACRTIKAADIAPSLEALAKTAGMSPFHFHRLFTETVGLTPKAYASAHRAERVREELSKRGTVTEAIYGAGYGSNSRFYSKSAEMLGMPPSRFQKGGAGETIRFAVGECSLGSVLAASTEAGVCAIFLGDEPGELVRELQDRFPNARLIGGDREYERTVSQVVGFVEAPSRGLDLPLDVRGTAFQQRVWRILRQIPCGTTRSYAQIAKQLGEPQASRAVAGACAANPIAVAIPCHRVVRRDGALSGYRWGVDRKAKLLESEGAEYAKKPR